MLWEYQDLAEGGELGAGTEIDVSEFSQEDKHNKNLVLQCAINMLDNLSFLNNLLNKFDITEYLYSLLVVMIRYIQITL